MRASRRASGCSSRSSRASASASEILSENESQIVLSEEDDPELPLDLGISLEREEREETSE